MLLKLKHDVGVPVAFPGLAPSVISIESDVFTYYGGNGKKMTYTQFAATLAYAITDYKCQPKTFEWVVVDIKKPGGRALLLLRRHTFNYLGQKSVVLYQFFVLSTQRSYRRNFLQSCCRNWSGKRKRRKRRRRCTTFSRTLSRSRKTAQNKYKYLH